MNKYFVMLPGFSTIDQSDLGFEEYCNKLNELIDECKNVDELEKVSFDSNKRLTVSLLFSPKEGICVYYYPSKYESMHVVVMTEKEYDNHRREQAFAMQQQMVQQRPFLKK